MSTPLQLFKTLDYIILSLNSEKIKGNSIANGSHLVFGLEKWVLLNRKE